MVFPGRRSSLLDEVLLSFIAWGSELVKVKSHLFPKECSLTALDVVVFSYLQQHLTLAVLHSWWSGISNLH